MKISLTKKIGLAFAGSSLILIVLFFSVTHFVVNTSFQRYIEENQEKRNQEVLEYLQNIYATKGVLSEDIFAGLMHMGMMEHYYLTLRDMNQNVIWSMDQQTMSMMHEMIGGSPKGMYLEKTYPIQVNEKVVGYVDIGRYDSELLSVADKKFHSSLYQGITGAAVVGTILAILLGLLMAKKLSKPIIQIKDTADMLQKGELAARAYLHSDTKEINQLVYSINQLGTSLEEQENLRKRLTSDISHELRTPLNVLKNHMEALMDGIWEPTAERLKICYDEVDRLADMIKDLEKLTNLESAQLELQKEYILFNDVVDSVIQQFYSSFAEKKVKLVFRYTKAIKGWADKNKLKQIMINLLSNALKFTEKEGKVDIEMFQEKSNAVIRIKDTGIGIASKDIKHIFERFYRADPSRNRKTGGAGLGLAIVKQIVEAHGGQIQVESKYKHGTCFTVILPLEHP